MSLWFYDESEELEEFKVFLEEARHAEREYLNIRVLLRDVKAVIRADPRNQEFKARVSYLRKKLEDLERQFLWLSSDVPKEIAIWGVT